MSDDFPPPDLRSSAGIGTTVSHSARIWDYWLGGKDNYPVDREVYWNQYGKPPGRCHSWDIMESPAYHVRRTGIPARTNTGNAIAGLVTAGAGIEARQSS